MGDNYHLIVLGADHMAVGIKIEKASKMVWGVMILIKKDINMMNVTCDESGRQG